MFKLNNLLGTNKSPRVGKVVKTKATQRNVRIGGRLIPPATSMFFTEEMYRNHKTQFDWYINLGMVEVSPLNFDGFVALQNELNALAIPEVTITFVEQPTLAAETLTVIPDLIAEALPEPVIAPVLIEEAATPELVVHSDEVVAKPKRISKRKKNEDTGVE